MTKQPSVLFSLEPIDNHRLLLMCGENNNHLRIIENRLEVAIKNRGHNFTVTGEKENIALAKRILEQLYETTETEIMIEPEEVHLMIHAALQQKDSDYVRDVYLAEEESKTAIYTKRGLIKTRSKNQHTYLQNILSHDINFGIGPAGTGKTYLAVACAVDALEKDIVRRIVLVRPAVEAGERLGFLPGDLAEKVDPYLRPLYDALYEMLGCDNVNKYLEKNIIEIAPLAYMRGRTLNNAFIILDESQNTTVEQMKMFLTRIGFGSKAVITGDITQIDLGHHQRSGLLHVIDVLENIPGISFNLFESKDVVRHPLVQKIVEAYDRFQEENK